MAQSPETRIRHTVVFRLKYPEGSIEEQDFLAAARKLKAIPGVEKLEVLKQVSPKNKYTFGLSMEFASQAEYEHYNRHPEHISFVKKRWMQEVEDFLEIDYQVLV